MDDVITRSYFAVSNKAVTLLPRNDPRQYDDLAHAWWDQTGPFAMLHWIAEARARLIPMASRPSAILLDIACGGGLLAPHVQGKGYTHIGVDLTESALISASGCGISVVRGDALALPFANNSADVVVAGEILEHVHDVSQVIAEACRVLRPGGLLVIDTIARTATARFLTITIAERIHGGAPPGLHDPALFVNRKQLRKECAKHGVLLQLRGLRPSLPSLFAWRFGQRTTGHMISTRSSAALFQAWGIKED